MKQTKLAGHILPEEICLEIVQYLEQEDIDACSLIRPFHRAALSVIYGANVSLGKDNIFPFLRTILTNADLAALVTSVSILQNTEPDWGYSADVSDHWKWPSWDFASFFVHHAEGKGLGRGRGAVWLAKARQEQQTYHEGLIRSRWRAGEVFVALALQNLPNLQNVEVLWEYVNQTQEVPSWLLALTGREDAFSATIYDFQPLNIRSATINGGWFDHLEPLFMLPALESLAIHEVVESHQWADREASCSWTVPKKSSGIRYLEITYALDKTKVQDFPQIFAAMIESCRRLESFTITSDWSRDVFSNVISGLRSHKTTLSYIDLNVDDRGDRFQPDVFEGFDQLRSLRVNFSVLCGVRRVDVLPLYVSQIVPNPDEIEHLVFLKLDEPLLRWILAFLLAEDLRAGLLPKLKTLGLFMDRGAQNSRAEFADSIKKLGERGVEVKIGRRAHLPYVYQSDAWALEEWA